MGTVTISRWATVIVNGGLSNNPSDPGSNPGWVATSGSNPTTQESICNALVPGGGPVVYVAAVGAVNAGLILAFDQATACFSLDGHSAISFNDLPSGIVFKNGVIDFSYGFDLDGNSGNYSVTLDPYLPSVVGTIPPDPPDDYTSDDIFNGLNITATELIGITLSMSFTGDNSDNAFYCVGLAMLTLTMEYELQQAFSFQVQDINTPVVAGEPVSIISPGPQDPDHPFDFNDLDGLSVQPSDGSPAINIPDWTVTPSADGSSEVLTFPWPDDPDPFPDGVPFGNIIGTTFSGSVTLGRRITIFFTNASGIYQFVPGKTTDTLYDVDDGTTVELAIPDPFAKTGYVGG